MVNLSIIDNVIFQDEIPFSTIFICVCVSYIMFRENFFKKVFKVFRKIFSGLFC